MVRFHFTGGNMPQLIWTFTDYFHHKQRDLYFIVFRDQHSGAPIFSAREELLAWLAEHLPDVQTGAIFPFHADSKVISIPYDGTIYADFDDESLLRFAQVWEDDNGKSLDPRLQCWVYPLTSYRAKYYAHAQD